MSIKKHILSKKEAFFEGLPLVLSSLFFDDNNRLIYTYWDEESEEEKTTIVANWPCLTEDAFLKAWYQSAEQYNTDESLQFPNKAAALTYMLGVPNIITKFEDEETGESIYSPIYSVEYCKDALSNCFRDVYKFHYKLVASDDYPSFGFYDDSCMLPYRDGVEYGKGVYKIEIVGYPEETKYVAFGSNLEDETSLPKGTYDVYIYSTQPTISINNDQYYTNNCTLTQLES